MKNLKPCNICPFYHEEKWGVERRNPQSTLAEECASELLEIGIDTPHPCLKYKDILAKGEPICIGHYEWLNKHHKHLLETKHGQASDHSKLSG